MWECNCARCRGDGPDDDDDGFAEWQAENTTYEMSCCGAELEYDDVTFDTKGEPLPMACPVCVDEETGEPLVESVNVVIPEPPEPDYDDDRDDRDYYDDEPRRLY
jgi:hypothetical protein